MPGADAGLTLIELLVAVAVLGILAAVAMPLAQITATRTRELELRRTLRRFARASTSSRWSTTRPAPTCEDAREIFKKKVSVDRTGYPLTLDELVETKILRRVPRDPMTADGKWVVRSFSDNPESSLSDAKDVYDIRSASKAVALDGTTYDTW